MPTTLTVVQYDAERYEERELGGLAELKGVPQGPGVLWLHVHGHPAEDLLQELGELFHLHPLALEDLLNGPQRPKAEEYEEQDFVIVHTVRLQPDHRVRFEQFSFFVGDSYVLSFHEGLEEVTAEVRERLQAARRTIRQHGVDHLMYALLDTVIDGYFPVLEDFGEHLETVQERALLREQPETLREIQRTRHELLHLRRTIWPLRDLLSVLMRDDNNSVSPPVRHYLRDCYDHVTQLMDMTEIYREMSGDLMDAYLSALSNRTNAIMKVLTIIATVFMPLTFIVGLYGMNFNTRASSWNMPELNWPYGYPATWAVMVAVVVAMLLWFRRRGWIGRKDLPEVEDLVMEEGAAETEPPERQQRYHTGERRRPVL